MSRKDFYYQSEAPTPNSIVPAASAVVTNHKDEILLHKRKDNTHWALPGGTMEIGESITQTLIREVKEETGFDVKITRCIGLYTDPNHIIQYSNGEVRQQFSICFACTIVGGTLTISSESTQVRFFKKDDLEQLDIHPAQRIRINDFFKDQAEAFIR